MHPPLITLLTDFGTTDTYVAQMKGVILGICPQANIVDLTHAIPPQDISLAAYTLLGALPAFPTGTIHLVVVDPGVGSDRRLLIAEADGRRFVAPDNGVLEPCLNSAQSLQVRELRETWFHRQPVSGTFHGRDILGPAAAHWALGTSPEKFGPLLTSPLVPLPAPPLVMQPQRVQGEVQAIDHFGNVVTNIPLTLVPPDRHSTAIVTVGTHSVSGIQRCYSDAAPGELLALGSSSGHLELAQRNGNAADLLQINRGMTVTVKWEVGASRSLEQAPKSPSQ